MGWQVSRILCVGGRAKELMYVDSQSAIRLHVLSIWWLYDLGTFTPVLRVRKVKFSWISLFAWDYTADAPHNPGLHQTLTSKPITLIKYIMYTSLPSNPQLRFPSFFVKIKDDPDYLLLHFPCSAGLGESSWKPSPSSDSFQTIGLIRAGTEHLTSILLSSRNQNRGEEHRRLSGHGWSSWFPAH